MPEGNLPEKARKVYLAAEASAKKTCPEGDDECVARKSWAAVKKGWKKVGDKWVPKAELEEFSFYINKAWVDNDSKELRWCAVNSDTDPDLYKDEMSLQLYADFDKRIKSKELPPERHQSDFWSGGMPYLSVSHYLDFNGNGVPGDVEDVYIDGNKLKSKGKFYNTPLGLAAYQAVRENFSDEKKANDEKVRISIAFIDWGHKHKSNGYEFIRESLDDICPECLKELITGKGDGRIFQLGHLIHLALTRKPVNQRTIITEELKSMTTRKEDAASIVGEELAEELEEKAKDELKADLVIKSEEPEVELSAAEDKKKEEEEEKKKKKEEEMYDEKKSTVIEIKAEVLDPEPHILDPAIDQFLAKYDEVVKVTAPYSTKLQSIQSAFEELGEAIKSSFEPTQEDVKQEELSEIKSLLTQTLEQVKSLTTEVGILKQTQLSFDPKKVNPTEVRRSYQIDPSQVFTPAQNTPKSIREISRRSVGLQ